MFGKTSEKVHWKTVDVKYPESLYQCFVTSADDLTAVQGDLLMICYLLDDYQSCCCETVAVLEGGPCWFVAEMPVPLCLCSEIAPWSQLLA
jgi:hypothetical protein